MPGEPLDQLRDQLDPGACRLVNLPERIWLFGGSGIFRLGSGEPCGSLRESFWRQTLSAPPAAGRQWLSDIDIPENHEGWWAFSGYSDLLTFERDSCYLARAIILFPESPGAIAELGALAVDDWIVDRLLVIVQRQFLEDGARKSFLNLGPLKRADDRTLQCVINTTSRHDLPPDDLEAVMAFLDARLPRVHHSEKLKLENPTHRLLLIADLIDLMMIARPSELQAALQHFGLDLPPEELERAVKLLAFFGLARLDRWGLEHFFVRRTRVDRAWVDYTSKDGQPKFDRSRFKVDRRALLASDRRQLAVLDRTA